MSDKQKIDAFSMLINILRDHEEKLDDLSNRVELVSRTLTANPTLVEALNQLEAEQSEAEPCPNILIVDDDEALAQSFKMILESAGFKVDVASTGEEAASKVGGKIYDLVLLDLNLPDMLGDEVAEKIGGRVKDIIFITGYSSLSEVADSDILKERELLLKPIEPSDLIKLTKKTISLDHT